MARVIRRTRRIVATETWTIACTDGNDPPANLVSAPAASSPNGLAESDELAKGGTVKKDYDRTTHECTINDLRAELRDAIRRIAREQLLGNVEAQQLVCVETKNERLQRGGLFGALTGTNDPDTEHYTAAVVTPIWLIWAMTGEKRGTTAFCARLTEVEARDYDMQALIEDDGLTITTLARGMSEKSSMFLGLGPGAAAGKFKSGLRDAIQKTNAASIAHSGNRETSS